MVRRIRKRQTAKHSLDKQDVHFLLGGPTVGHFSELHQRWWNVPEGTDRETVLQEARDAWQTLKPLILDRYIELIPCDRPWAWFQFDAPKPIDEDEEPAEYLERHGLLTKVERTAAAELAERIERDAEQLREAWYQRTGGYGPNCGDEAEHFRSAAWRDYERAAIAELVAPFPESRPQRSAYAQATET